MAQFQTIEIGGFIPAIAGMRHPLKSYDKADSQVNEEGNLALGENDYNLAKRLIQAGSPEHAKFLRQIQVWVNITAPRYFWSEFDTYKVGTTANSQSTMHRLIKDGISKEEIDFPWGLSEVTDNHMINQINVINSVIDTYNATEDPIEKENLFLAIKSLLPEGYIQTRMVSLNYQVLRNIYKKHKNHRLPHWNDHFVNWVKTLPVNEWITEEFLENSDSLVKNQELDNN